MSLPSFPFALQAQIVRANQRDLFHVSSLREQTEAGLRPWLGTRWLTRWDKELDLLTKLLYFGLTTGRATQTLGEEYTDVWQHSAINGRPPSRSLRAMLVLLSTLPTYVLTRWGAGMPERWRMIPTVLSVFAEVNLAVFYLNGAYYDLAKRLLGVRYISSIPQDPRTRPPSYALLGILLAIRLLHRLITHIRSSQVSRLENSKKPDYRARETYIDDRPVSTFLGPVDPEGEPAKPAEEDEGTILDMSSIPPAQRAGRNCTLCLEERVDSCATECGHLFCWSCIVGWGREKAECPLCRQSLSLTRLLPIYNL